MYSSSGLIPVFLLIVGGIMAISGLIVAKKPDAKALLDKLTPYQAFIGIAMLGVGVWNLINWLRLGIFSAIKVMPLLGLSVLAIILCSLLLGFMFGMPQIAKWIPGDSPAETKAAELSRKLAPFQVILGLIGIGACLIYLLYHFSILKP